LGKDRSSSNLEDSNFQSHSGIRSQEDLALYPSGRLSDMHHLKDRFSRLISQKKAKNLKREVKIDENLIQQTLEKVAPKVMRYEKELQRIRNELGENTRVIDLTPNKQIVINLDVFGQSVGP
jgi:hypothetical protein